MRHSIWCSGSWKSREDAQAGPLRTGLNMSEPFRPYEKLVAITVFGKRFQVPERNSLLRCFQFISPETFPYGRFGWNQDCQYCRVSCQLPDEDEPREMLSCKFMVMTGMEITEMSQELKWCLQAKLFFFKQKTAYDIDCDWSSDVCSSDLLARLPQRRPITSRLRRSLPGCSPRPQRRPESNRPTPDLGGL